MLRLAIATAFLLLPSCSREQASSTHSLGESAEASCDGGHPTLLFQVIPGFNPDNVSYVATATVTANGQPLPRTFTITSGGPIDEQTIRLDGLETGETFTVTASFDDGSGAPPITCERSWIAVSPGSIGCGPVEIGYQVGLGTCQLVCD